MANLVVGELRRGVELIRHRGDRQQAARLEQWLQQILDLITPENQPPGAGWHLPCHKPDARA